jgi:DNA-binding response OmpR family regulator
MADSTVLVVDDEPRILQFLEENLRADDFSVLTASGGEEAIEVLRRAHPDVVLLDVVLPDMSGYDVCRRLRSGDAVADPWDPDVPIIMLSAKAEHTDRIRGLERGADDYVTKASALLSRAVDPRSAGGSSTSTMAPSMTCARSGDSGPSDRRITLARGVGTR